MAPQQDEDATRDSRALLDFAATTDSNLYQLLDLSGPDEPSASSTSEPPTGPSDQDLKRAWRRAALKHHPDKNRGNEAAAATALDACRQAYAVLLDPAARARYDARRRAAREKRIRDEAVQGRRRKMVQELERRERERHAPASGAGSGASTPASASASARGEKRGWGAGQPFGSSGGGPAFGGAKTSAGGGGVGQTEKDFADDIRRLAAEGARKRAERDERNRRRRTMEAEAETEAADETESLRAPGSAPPKMFGVRQGPSDAPSSKTPKFSFSPAAAASHTNGSETDSPLADRGSGAASGSAKGASSLYERTMARLKDAERQRKQRMAQDGDAVKEKQDGTDHNAEETGGEAAREEPPRKAARVG